MSINTCFGCINHVALSQRYNYKPKNISFNENEYIYICLVFVLNYKIILIFYNNGKCSMGSEEYLFPMKNAVKVNQNQINLALF
jgi:hypothetical protein